MAPPARSRRRARGYDPTVATKTRQRPRPITIDGLPPHMLRYLPLEALPRRPMGRYLLFSLAFCVAWSLTITAGWVVVGLPLTMPLSLVRLAICFAVPVKFMTELDRRWRRTHLPMHVERAVGIMMTRYARANAESAPWN